jgi:hypothetical protein
MHEKKAAGERRDRIVTVVVSGREKARIAQAAQQSGLPLSSYCRSALLRDLGRGTNVADSGLTRRDGDR